MVGQEGAFEPHMNAADAVMWDIEKDPILRSTITAIAVLDRSPDWERLVDRIQWGTCEVPRLRQRVIVPPFRIGPPRWVTDPDFDLHYHLRRVRVPEPGGMRDVLDLAQPIAMDGFDRARPLWEFTLVEGMAEGRAALVQKVHHSLTDGVGGMKLAAMLLDEEPEASPPEASGSAPAPGQTSRLAVLGGSVADGARLFGGRAAALPSVLGRVVRNGILHPVGTATSAGATARSIGRALAPVTEPGSPLMRARSLARRFDVLDIPFEQLRAAGHAVGGTLNDAFLAAVIGGVKRYHHKHGAALEQLHVTMPISFRGEDDPLGGNRFAPARFPAPAGISDPVERMQRLGALARSWRDEPATGLTDQLAEVLDRLPVTVLTGIFGGMLKSIDLVATNIPGIPERVFLGGAAVEGEYAFAPPTGAALSVALLTYAETACIGVVLDTAAVPDPDLLVRCLADELDEILAVGASASPQKLRSDD